MSWLRHGIETKSVYHNYLLSVGAPLFLMRSCSSIWYTWRTEVMMSTLLDKVIAEVAKLPDHEQDTIAAWILEELKSENLWETLFSGSLHQLESLADRALADHREGRAPMLDPDKV